jgi:hypothetical protein
MHDFIIYLDVYQINQLAFPHDRRAVIGASADAGHDVDHRLTDDELT